MNETFETFLHCNRLWKAFFCLRLKSLQCSSLRHRDSDRDPCSVAVCKAENYSLELNCNKRIFIRKMTVHHFDEFIEKLNKEDECLWYRPSDFKTDSPALESWDFWNFLLHCFRLWKAFFGFWLRFLQCKKMSPMQAVLLELREV